MKKLLFPMFIIGFYFQLFIASDCSSKILKNEFEYLDILKYYIKNNPESIEGRFANCLVNNDYDWKAQSNEIGNLNVLYFYQSQGLYEKYKATAKEEYIKNAIDKMRKLIVIDELNAFPRFYLSFLYNIAGDNEKSESYFYSALRCKIFETYAESGCLLYTKFNLENHLINENNLGYFIRGYDNISLEHTFLSYFSSSFNRQIPTKEQDGLVRTINNLCKFLHENENIIDWVEYHILVSIANAILPYRNEAFFPKGCYEKMMEETLPLIKKAIENPQSSNEKFELIGAVKIAFESSLSKGDTEPLRQTKYWRDILNTVERIKEKGVAR